MKRFAVVLGLIGLLLLVGAAIAKDMPKAKTVTLKGELVDTGCYLGHGAHGEKHKECALKCASNGMPIALLVKEKLYLITPNHDDADPYNKAKEWMGQTVEATGTLMQKGGITAIDLTSIKEATESAAK